MYVTNVIYADLESILDLRQGAMSLVEPDSNAVADYMTSPHYNQRYTDDLKYLTGKQYRDIIATGNERILTNSMPNYNLGAIATEIGTILVMPAEHKSVNVPEVWINTYPFELQEEGVRKLEATLFVKLGKDTQVRVFSLPNSKISPEFILANNVRVLFIYNSGQWTDLHGQAIMETDIRNTRFMFSPILDKEPTPEMLEEMDKNGYGDIFTFFSLSISPFINASFLPTAFYNNFITSKNIIAGYVDTIRKDSHDKGEKLELDEDEINEILGSKL